MTDLRVNSPLRTERLESAEVKEDGISVLIVRNRNGQVCNFVLDELIKEHIQGHLKPIIDNEGVLYTDCACLYKTFAKQENVAHQD
jgi:hypothetical protein